ncbi:hypothetical protein HID58_051735 [Brassica napus]|uniref:MD-2-related lipid-recognition domain-containing protein n=4 Tax=Brassica TaxID=3705 RepID=A0ABQ8A9X7_BRANA|nr:hypothetical protein HID58_051735 [Brassica napus]CDY23957.1 BnaC03g17340D [Brassica napus]VDC88624.1 unnamed protein product [Brassica oleracea]VDC88686.1 unnamed protein product [Brassica oleracea]
MSHVQPLLLLLASLFFLPFTRAVDFVYCNNVGYDFGTVTALEVEPSDQIFEISLSFSTSSTIKSPSLAATLDVSLMFENMNILQSSSLICNTGVCPLEPSKDYVINTSVIRPSIPQVIFI